MTKWKFRLAALLAPAVLALASSAAWAQSYPNKPVRLVLPYAPGSWGPSAAVRDLISPGRWHLPENGGHV